MRHANSFDVRALERTQVHDGGQDAAADTVVTKLRFNGPINARDEVIFWLTAAAEIEHALMVQYLFAAYSLDPDGANDQSGNVQRLQRTLLQIAREEMGHLITVQNLLVVLGGPLHLERSHSPFTSEVHPFRFKLEPVSLGSLAKYVVAESPDLTPDDIDMLSDERKNLLHDVIAPQAIQNNDGRPVRHVGPIFARLIELIRNGFPADAIHTDRIGQQADWADWGYFASRSDGLGDAHGGRVLVRRVSANDPEAARTQIIDALQDIGDQGEFVDNIDDLDESHFERFLQAYEALQSIEDELNRSPVWPVATFPNTTVASDQSGIDAMLARPMDGGRISHPRTRDWARFFNLRYRILLQTLINSFAMDETIYETVGGRKGRRTAKGLLHAWAFAEMVRIKKLSKKLVSMPLDQVGAGKNAGPPFELPYLLRLLPFETDRWRSLADLFAAGQAWALEIQAQYEPDADDPFLSHVAGADATNQVISKALAETGTLSEPSPREDRFLRVVKALEEAVRGFDISDFRGGSVHKNFWADKTRDELVASTVIIPGSADQSPLVDRISRGAGTAGAMPRSRPNIPESRIQLIRDWIDAGCPDADPPWQIGLIREPAPSAEARPDPPQPPMGGAPSFQTDISPLFTPFDRQEMIDWFDLHKYEDVKTHSEKILERLEIGDMPCTGAWPASNTETFKRWINADFPV